MKKAVAMHQKSPRVKSCLLNFLKANRKPMTRRASGRQTHKDTQD